MGTPRLRYNNISVDFVRRPNIFQADLEANFVDNLTANGINERLSYFNRWRIGLGKRMLTSGEAFRLQKFFEYVRDGSSFEFWYDPEIGDYVTFDGKALTTANGNAQSTFTRSGTVGTYIDADTGLITAIGTADTARYEDGQFGHAMLLEMASTNSLVRSSEFDNASWTKTNAAVAANVSGFDDPAGTNLADRITISGGVGTVLQVSAYTPLASTTPVTASCSLRGITGNVTVNLDLVDQTNGTVGTTAATVTPTAWTRFSVIAAASWDAINPARFQLRSADGTQYWAFGAQLEGAKRYASSYIPTVAAAVTRNTDRLEYTATNFLDEATQKFSMSYWFYPQFGITDATTRFMFWVDSIVSSGRQISVAINSSNNWEFRVYTADSTVVANTGGSASTLTQSAWHHVVVTCDSTATNGLNVYLDGTLQSGSSANPFAIGNLSATPKIGVGAQTGTGGITAPGRYDDIAFFKKALSAAEVLNIYNAGIAGRPIGLRRNYWSALRLRDSEFAPELTTGGNRYNWQATFEEVLT